MITKKTVYILGAGFSLPAGAPDQAAILSQIFALKNRNCRVKNYKADLKRFLSETLGIAQTNHERVFLEDIYTPIDRCIADGVSLRNTSPVKLQEVRDKLEHLISLAVDQSFTRSHKSKKQYVTDFATYIVDVAAKRAELARNTTSAEAAKQYDPLSIISLNWDILLDTRLYEALRVKDGNISGDYDPIGVVDYCCYISSIEKRQSRIRSGLWTLGARGYNVKLLKLHGSLNWLQCSNCQRLFVGFEQKLTISDYIETEKCRHCRRRGIEPAFKGSLVMPTFLKDLSNFQIKLIWQNASVELLEADKLVFIGYSLPHADFEFRQLMARMVHRKAGIEVVLWKGKSKASKRRYYEDCVRYEQFFPGRGIKFWPNGMENKIQNRNKAIS